MKRVLVIDDHAIIRRGIADLLTSTGAYEVAGEASRGDEAMALLASTHCDLVIPDISMPGLSGFDVLKLLKKSRPPQPAVLVLTMHREEPYFKSAIDLGASGFLTKDTALEQLLTALDTIFAGGSYFVRPPSSDGHSDSQFFWGSDNGFPNLSRREQMVLEALVQGESLTSLAERTNVSVKTISTYRSRLLEKLGATSNAELISLALNRTHSPK